MKIFDGNKIKEKKKVKATRSVKLIKKPSKKNNSKSNNNLIKGQNDKPREYPKTHGLKILPIGGLKEISKNIILLVLTKFVSIASISASVGISILTAIFHNDEPKFIFTMILLSIFAVYRHKSNISNLINGTESKFYFRKNKNQQGGL